jgi:hypothetical protein
VSRDSQDLQGFFQESRDLRAILEVEEPQEILEPQDPQEIQGIQGSLDHEELHQ